VINLANARHRDDPRPIDEASAHESTRTYSRAYLSHLVRVNELLGQMLLSAINLAYYQNLMAGLREAIAQRRVAAFCAATREGWTKGDLPPL
jgi:queuine tRNA-ribosyltransferase